MKAYRVTKAKWANWRDLELPFYRQWNGENPLSATAWQGIWEHPFVALEIPARQPCLAMGGFDPIDLCRCFPKALSVDFRPLDDPHLQEISKEQPLQNQPAIQRASTIDMQNDSCDYSFSIGAGGRIRCHLDALREQLRITRRKALITFDISDVGGLSAQELVELKSFLDFDLPAMPSDCVVSDDPRLKRWGITPTHRDNHIRILALVIEPVEAKTDCGIIIPHWESYAFAKAAIRHIRKQENELVRQCIYLIDDNSKDGSFERLQAEFGADEDIRLWQVERQDDQIANVGSLLDSALTQVNERYVCMLDADAFPISPHWLSFPIWLIERYGCSAVGCDTGLSNAYLPNRFTHWQNNQGYQSAFGLYDNENFICINNFYRVMKTSIAQVVAEKAGFARRGRDVKGIKGFFYRIRRRYKRLRRRLLPYFGKVIDLTLELADADNGVIANCFMDLNRMGPKFNLPILSWVGLTPKDGVFGQNICDLLFHFALSTRALSRCRREVTDSGVEFQRYAERILSEGFTDALLMELIRRQELRAGGYDGSIPKSWYEKARVGMQKELEIYLQR